MQSIEPISALHYFFRRISAPSVNSKQRAAFSWWCTSGGNHFFGNLPFPPLHRSSDSTFVKKKRYLSPLQMCLRFDHNDLKDQLEEWSSAKGDITILWYIIYNIGLLTYSMMLINRHQCLSRKYNHIFVCTQTSVVSEIRKRLFCQL